MSGPEPSQARHAQNRITLHDVFFRVGGGGCGPRAGPPADQLQRRHCRPYLDMACTFHEKVLGWTSNTSANGLVVNGDDVTLYGLFVEHHQQFQVLWKGNGGRTYFYQSEIPYDPPDQLSYSSAPGTNGWASYKVADSVTRHEAWGLGIYSVFIQPSVVLSRAIEVPPKPGIRFHHMITVALGNHGGNIQRD